MVVVQQVSGGITLGQTPSVGGAAVVSLVVTVRVICGTTSSCFCMMVIKKVKVLVVSTQLFMLLPEVILFCLVCPLDEFRSSSRGGIQCVSLDSTSLVIYPEIKATEVPRFKAGNFTSVAFISG